MFSANDNTKTRNENAMKKDYQYYEKLFSQYPDLVTVLQFRKMLNGIGDTFARRLIREKKVKCFTLSRIIIFPSAVSLSMYSVRITLSAT